jgi:hypothetical protein
MAVVFWDRKGVLLEEFKQQCTTISEMYCKTPKTLRMNNWLKPHHFDNNEELTEGFKTWLSSQVADFFDTGIQLLIPRQKCLICGCDYVEK